MAQHHLHQAGVANVLAAQGDGSAGYDFRLPYDRSLPPVG